jgi:hypothetical protein
MIMPDRPAGKDQSIQRSGVRNEYVTAQIGLRADDVPAAPLSFQWTDLTGPAGATIAKSSITLFRAADIKVDHDTAIVRGVERLTGAPVEATDLRAGSSLLCAALGADGRTEMVGVEHIDRGYEQIDEKLILLGAHLSRVHAEGEWPSTE